MIVTFVLCAYQERYAPFVSLGSLLCQTNENWKAIVMHNGPWPQAYESNYRHFNDERISYHESEVNTGTDLTSRTHALHNLVDTEIVVSSSIQDFYFPRMVEHILEAAKDNDFIFWNSINHLFHDNHILDCYPEPRKADWGNFAVKTELAKRVDFLNFDNQTSDGTYAREIAKLATNRKKINKVLTVHV